MDLIKLIIYMSRECVFSSKEEYDFKSAKFNVKKFFTFVIMTTSILANLLMFYRVYAIAKETVRCHAEVTSLKAMAELNNYNGTVRIYEGEIHLDQTSNVILTKEPEHKVVKKPPAPSSDRAPG